MLKKLALTSLSSLVLMIGSFSFAAMATTDSFGTESSATSVGVQQGTDGNSLITVVQNFINIVLGLLFLIALAVLLWGGFQMVTAAGDDGKYQNGFKILKQAGFGLALIGLSFIILRFIFGVLSTATSGA